MKQLILLIGLFAACSAYQIDNKQNMETRCHAYKSGVPNLCTGKKGQKIKKVIALNVESCQSNYGTIPTNAVWVANKCAVRIIWRY